MDTPPENGDEEVLLPRPSPPVRTAVPCSTKPWFHSEKGTNSPGLSHREKGWFLSHFSCRVGGGLKEISTGTVVTTEDST